MSFLARLRVFNRLDELNSTLTKTFAELRTIMTRTERSVTEANAQLAQLRVCERCGNVIHVRQLHVLRSTSVVSEDKARLSCTWCLPIFKQQGWVPKK